MSKRLFKNLNSRYIEAANKLRPKKSRQKIMAFVESYDDVFFWSSLLRELETDKYYFEVALPSRTSLCKGKKVALMNVIGEQLGNYMIACVDADYDYLMQGANDTSRFMMTSPYVFHTYVYAIENYQCYASSLHNVCVMATLNDRHVFDFETFLTQFSEIVWPLFVWSIWCYRYGMYKCFSMADLFAIVVLYEVNFYNPEKTLEYLRRKVNRKISWLQRRLPQAKETYTDVRDDLIRLGVTPQTTYLFMRGHDIFDGIVVPLAGGVCEILRRERERDIRNLAEHNIQMQNELASYQHSSAPIEEMLRKHTEYKSSEQYKMIQKDVRDFLNSFDSQSVNSPKEP